jgi:hypothetical protein
MATQSTLTQLNEKVIGMYKPFKNLLNTNTPDVNQEDKVSEIVEALGDFIIGQEPQTSVILSSMNKFYLLLINYPVIWLKILLTFTFWVTLNEIVVSKTVQSLFTSFVAEDTSNLTTKGFVHNPYEYDQNITSNDKIIQLQNVAKLWYDVVLVFAKSSTISEIEDQIKNMVQIANNILGDNVGDRAKAACEASARGTTLFHYIRLMGCLSGLTQEPECVQIKQALADLITATGTQ